jgi:hypothetical protein
MNFDKIVEVKKTKTLINLSVSDRETHFIIYILGTFNSVQMFKQHEFCYFILIFTNVINIKTKTHA